MYKINVACHKRVKWIHRMHAHKSRVCNRKNKIIKVKFSHSNQNFNWDVQKVFILNGILQNIVYPAKKIEV